MYSNIQTWVFAVCAGNCGIKEGPCYEHDDCKTGLNCGKDNCIRATNFEKITYDCCEKC